MSKKSKQSLDDELSSISGESDNELDEDGIEYDSDSTKSEYHKIFFPDSNAIHPSISQSIVQVDPQTLNCTIRIAKKRPPTAVTGQGRHVSAYALMLLVIKNRLDGKNVKDAYDLVKELITEYIKEDESLKGFYEEIELLVKKSGLKHEEYEKRLAIYNADKATAEFLNSSSVRKTIDDISVTTEHKEMVELFKKMLEAQEKRKEIAPIDVRNMMKRAQEAYSPFISDLIAITIIMFNRTTDAAKNFSQPQKSKNKDDSDDEEMVGENSAIKSLSEGKIYQKKNGNLDGNKIAEDMAALFDYKYDLVLEEYERQHGKKGDKAGLRTELCHVMRRHIKMCYDAFPFVKDLLDEESNRKIILELFCKEVREKDGWKNHNHEDFTSKEKLYERLLRPGRLKFENKKCIITDKSSVKKKHGKLVDKLNDSRGGIFPSTSYAGIDFLSTTKINLSPHDNFEDSVDFITLYKEGEVDDLIRYVEILGEKESEEFVDDLAGIDDVRLSGKAILNDERFLAQLCFLSQNDIRYNVNHDVGFIEVIDEDDEITHLISIFDFATIRSNQTQEQISQAKTSRLTEMQEIISSVEKPVFISINFSGHFALLAIDPNSKTYRYIDSLEDALNGNISQNMVFNATDLRTPYDPKKDLFTDLKAILDDNEYEASNTQYSAQQYSKEIHKELVRRRREQIIQSEDLTEAEIEERVSQLKEECKKQSHNNECGFLVAANIVSMINSDDIEVDLADKNNEEVFYLDPLKVLHYIRPAFDQLCEEIIQQESEQSSSLIQDSDSKDIPSSSSKTKSAKKAFDNSKSR